MLSRMVSGWLVMKRGEYAEVAHARDYVVPVGFAEVQVRFFSEEKYRFEFPALQGIHKFA
jgi:hypothetical protein